MIETTEISKNKSSFAHQDFTFLPSDVSAAIEMMMPILELMRMIGKCPIILKSPKCEYR